jgi:hypothetical protein
MKLLKIIAKIIAARTRISPTKEKDRVQPAESTPVRL